jgi:hypothetical protein
MAGVETGLFRGENGIVLTMDLPLGDAFAGRLKRGEIVRVNEDGSMYDDAVAAAAVVAKQALVDELADARLRIGELEDQLAEALVKLDAAIETSAKPKGGK